MASEEEEDAGVEAQPGLEAETLDVAVDWQVGWGWSTPVHSNVVGPNGERLPPRTHAMVGFSFTKANGERTSFALPIEQANALCRAGLKHVRSARTARN